MKRNRLIAFALSVSLLLGASACGKPAKTVSELIAEENAILDQHQELWTTALNSLDKDNLSQSTQSTNYADVLDLAIKNVKEQLSDEDYKTLTDDAAKVRKLEDQLQELPPEEGTTASDDSTFPAFEGKDLDGNAVDSSLFANNAFTVVNLWFSGCKPCVAELGDLDKLNQTVKAQGGEVIGINTETLDDNADAIATAKQILQTKGASYRNITFASGSEAGQFALNTMAFPTTYVIDRNGKIVGKPVLGGITNESSMTQLQENIELKGFQKNPYPYIKNAKLLCITSRWEGFGLVAIEANMLGVPVLSTDNAGCSEILGEEAPEICRSDEEFLEKIWLLKHSDEEYSSWKARSVVRGRSFDNIETYMANMACIYRNEVTN